MMRFRCMVIGSLTVALACSQANAAIQPITGKKLLLKSTPKTIVLSKDPSIDITGADPIGASTNSYVTFSDGVSSVNYLLPPGYWKMNGSGTLLRYKNSSVAGSVSPVKILKIKPGLLKMVAVDLPFPVPTGAATIHVSLHLAGATSNTYCMTFSGNGDPSKFLVKDAGPGDCQLCGDDELDGSEQCDGTEDAACPGLCQPDCTCDLSGGACCETGSMTCTNNTSAQDCATAGGTPVGGGATCDATGSCGTGPGTPDGCCMYPLGPSSFSCEMPVSQTECAGGAFFPYATCSSSGICADQRPPCESTAGGYCWFRGASGDSCDTTCGNNYRYYHDATATYAGSAGTGTNCAALAADFGKSGALDTVCSTGVGCYDSGLPPFFRCASPTTTSGASQAGFERICACASFPQVPCEATTGGFCWYLGAQGESCDTVCANNGRDYHTATASYAGSGGTDAQCNSVLSALGAPGSTTASFGGTGELGCHYNTSLAQRLRADAATTSSGLNPNSMRACACQ